MERLRSADVQVGDTHALSTVNTFQTYRARAIGNDEIDSLVKLRCYPRHDRAGLAAQFQIVHQDATDLERLDREPERAARAALQPPRMLRVTSSR
jgi:hypothetical protein